VNLGIVRFKLQPVHIWQPGKPGIYRTFTASGDASITGINRDYALMHRVVVVAPVNPIA